MCKNFIFFALLMFSTSVTVADDCGSENSCAAACATCQPARNCCRFQRRYPFGSAKCCYYYPCHSLFINSRVFALPDDEPLWVGQRDDDFVDALTR